MLRIGIIFSCLFCLIMNQVLAFDLDETVDDEIRKNYNSSKLIQDTNTGDLEELPALPERLKNEKSGSVTKAIQQKIITPEQQKIVLSGNITIKKGTVINVVNSSKISDWQTSGTTVKFTAKKPISGKNYTIPASAIFTGEIIESHQPQITCNGGLVVIRVNALSYNGQTVPVNAYITRANGKNIFFNDIKGERTYLKTMWKKGNWGRNIFNRMCTLTVKLGGDGSTLLLSPFPFAYGTICLGLNAITSPICAFFHKGGHVSIPAGSNFRIKLLEDAYIF